MLVRNISMHVPVREIHGITKYFDSGKGWRIDLAPNRVFTVTSERHPEYRRCIPMENVYEFEPFEAENGEKKAKAAT